VRDSESDFRSTYKGIRRLHKAAGYVQILCVRSDVSLRLERNYLNSGNERKTLLAMRCERDEITSLSPKFYSKKLARWFKTMHRSVYLVTHRDQSGVIEVSLR